MILTNAVTFVIACYNVEVPVLMADTILPEVTPAREGDNVTLQCAPAITYPLSSIIWLANGSNTQVTTENITIGPVNDSVIYQCLVEAVFTPTTNKVGLPLSTSLITTTLVDCKYLIITDCGVGVRYILIYVRPLFPLSVI